MSIRAAGRSGATTVRAKGRQGASGPGLGEDPELLGFLVVWVSGFLPFASVFLVTFGLNWWIPRASGGALLGVTVGVANAVALLAAVLVAGAVDRADRASLLLMTCAAAAAGSLLLLPGFALGAEGLLAVAAAVLAYLSAEGVESLHRAGAETTLADLAPGVWAPDRTASYVGVQPQGARLLAPAVGGALLAAGTPWLLPVVAGAFALLAALPLLSPGMRRLLMGRSPGRRDTGAQGWWSVVRGSLGDARMAAGWMRERPVMLFLLVVGFACNLVVYPFYSLLPAFLLEAGLGDDAALYGRAATAYGAGMLLCTLLFVAVPTRVRRPALVCTLVMLAVVAVLWSATVSVRPATLVVLMALLGALFMTLVAVGGGAWLGAVPGEVRVRVLALKRLVAFGSIPLGTAALGLGGAAFGFVPTLRALLGLVLVILAVAWCMLRAGSREREERRKR
jgi:hypothetical protein